MRGNLSQHQAIQRQLASKDGNVAQTYQGWIEQGFHIPYSYSGETWVRDLSTGKTWAKQGEELLEQATSLLGKGVINRIVGS